MTKRSTFGNIEKLHYDWGAVPTCLMAEYP